MNTEIKSAVEILLKHEWNNQWMINGVTPFERIKKAMEEYASQFKQPVSNVSEDNVWVVKDLDEVKELDSEINYAVHHYGNNPIFKNIQSLFLLAIEAIQKKFSNEHPIKEVPVSEDVENAAKDYVAELNLVETGAMNDAGNDFKAGAEWQKQQPNAGEQPQEELFEELGEIYKNQSLNKEGSYYDQVKGRYFIQKLTK
jgi:hypothetical protein